MKKNLLFRAFLPLAAYAVFTELALHGLAGILAAASDGWTGAVSPNLGAAVLWANAAAGLAVSGLFWRQYGREEEEGKVSVRSRFAGDEGQKALSVFINDICEEIRTKRIRPIEVTEEENTKKK